MFARLAQEYFAGNAHDLLHLHPAQLANFLEGIWVNAPRNAQGRGPNNRPRPYELVNINYPLLQGSPTTNMNNTTRGYTAPATNLSTLTPRVDWQHLIYAYMLENTRMTQIFYRVLTAFLTGETLNTPSPATQAWLRNTEMLFYRHLPGFYTYALRSEIRPDAEATRRNAYYRMFGMDLVHGTDSNKAYPFTKPQHSNRDFVPTIEKLLREFYQAVINQSNTSGTNSTDFASIATLCTNLRNMLQVRRQGGNLTREEFNAVAMMSWFHFTLEQGTHPLISDLGATANSPEDRLIKVGQKVGLAANPQSGSFFDLANLLSSFLLQIESGQLDTVSAVQTALGTVGFRQDITNIITQWSNATKRDIKAIKTSRQLVAG
ncbi:hypothetical protein [Lewinella sp. W8]|uniref:hypothetical protein n=1 Tax=Lewinella sp. W8 TaxID=2528208 RepID=UPI00106809B7|nr:hypothetical protein [Lewinella sp. W8]MTB51146.1 hypothetical protein [Lewinella sp. W8]